MFQTYFPEKFCREFVEIKGNSIQVAGYMALVLGLKPFLDDLIPTDKILELKKACRKYGLFMREDVVFSPAKIENLGNVIDAQYVTSTIAYGLPLGVNVNAYVHVFITKDKRNLSQGMWYPLVIKNRRILQPRIDSLKYGKTLGYPACCVNFFRKFNNWSLYSYLYEVFCNTAKKPHYFCNPFTKDNTYSYIYHMPCAYNCQETIKWVGRLRREINRKEPSFVSLTDKILKMPFLVFYERKFYIFQGRREKNRIFYKNAYFCDADKRKDIYSDLFSRGNNLILKTRTLEIYRNSELIQKIEIPFTTYAPETPFIMQFYN